MTKEELLLDTLKYYTEDINRRCVPVQRDDGGLGCYYDPKKAGKEGVSDGCAIGRWMSDEQKAAADDAELSSLSTVTSVKYLKPEYIPKALKGFDIKFLSEIQTLHDNGLYWNKSKGLSKDGRIAVKFIVDEFQLEKDLLADYLPKSIFA